MVEYRGIEMEESHMRAHKLAEKYFHSVTKTFDEMRAIHATENNLDEFQVVSAQTEGLVIALTAYAKEMFALSTETATEFGQSILGQLSELNVGRAARLRALRDASSAGQEPGGDQPPSA